MDNNNMMNQMNPTKQCKHCNALIPIKAKVCPVCKKSQSGKAKWIIIVVAVIIVLSAIAGVGGSDESDSGNDKSTATNISENTDSEKTEKEQTKEKEETIEYTPYSVSEMMSDLDANAMNASDKYKGKYIEITGKLNVIDSSGKYISLVPSDEEYAIIGVHCTLKSDEQKEAVKSMSIGDEVTLRGKCTDVGEVMGYSLNIDSIGQ